MKKTRVAMAAAAVMVTATSALAADENHTARIPAGSDVSSIKFVGVKVVTIPTTETTTTEDARYCEQAAHRDPGGSLFCPAVTPSSFTRVFEVTYSYEGQPLASDESGNRHFTFSVYFRPDELESAERQLLSRWKGSRADRAASFIVTTAPDVEPELVVDGGRSRLCERTYADGVAVPANARCEDRIQYKTAAVPTGYIVVRIEPTSSTETVALVR